MESGGVVKAVTEETIRSSNSEGIFKSDFFMSSGRQRDGFLSV